MLKGVNGKIVDINEYSIHNYMQKLNISEAEAIDLYLYDNGYIDNAEAEAMTSKAKALPKEHVKTVKTVAQTERKPKERKPNEAKRKLIDFIYKGLVLAMDSTTIQVINAEKEIAFNYKGIDYSITLTAHRSKKESGK